ncbi:MAG: hypothetical protein SFY70_05935 [Bacteroidia bacterium]|nr:hypothetical protein [Bacteroidia bacterium]
MEAELNADLERANAAIARAEQLALAVARLQDQLGSLRQQLAEKDRRLQAQQHEIQGLRDQLNLFKLAKRFTKTDSSPDYKAKIDTLIEAIDRTLAELALETGATLHTR